MGRFFYIFFLSYFVLNQKIFSCDEAAFDLDGKGSAAVFADYLEEIKNKPLAAEFLRELVLYQQLILDTWGDAIEEPKERALRRSLERMLPKVKDDLFPGFPRSIKRLIKLPTFFNGMVHRIPLRVDQLNRYQALFENPLLQGISILNLQDAVEMTSLLSFSKLKKLKTLKFTGNRRFLPDFVRDFVTSPNLENLQHLSFENLVQPGILRALAHPNATIKNLVSLNMNSSNIDRADMEAFMASNSALSRLQELHIRKTLVENSNALQAFLSKNPGVKGLRLLDLSSNDINVEGTNALARGPFLQLEHLALSDSGIDTEDLRYLTHGPKVGNFQKLETLVLDTNDIDNSGFALLADPKSAMRYATKFNLRDNEFSGEAMELLTQSEHGLKNVKDLDLSKNPIADLGASYLARANLPRLRRLNLAGCSITAEGLKFLSQENTVLANVEELDLRGNLFDVDGLEVLAQAGSRLKRLETVYLSKFQYSEFEEKIFQRWKRNMRKYNRNFTVVLSNRGTY